MAVPGCQAFLSSQAQARTFARVGPAIFMHKHKVRSRSEYSSAAARNASGSMLASSSGNRCLRLMLHRLSHRPEMHNPSCARYKTKQLHHRHGKYSLPRSFFILRHCTAFAFSGGVFVFWLTRCQPLDICSRFNSEAAIKPPCVYDELQEANSQSFNFLVMLVDDGWHRFVPVRLWLLAHGLLDFFGAAAAGGAYGVFICWCHAASRRARSFAPKAISSSRSTVAKWQCVRGYSLQMMSIDPLLFPDTGLPVTGLINASRPAVMKRTSLAVWIASLNQPTEVSAGTSMTVPI